MSKRTKYTTKRGAEAKRWRVIEAKALREPKPRNARDVDVADTLRAIEAARRSRRNIA